MSYEFKVGDKVKVTKRGTHGFKVGEEVEVLRLSTNAGKPAYHAKGDDGSTWYLFTDEGYPMSKSYQLADGSWSSEYKVGDKFVVTGEKETFSVGSIIELFRSDSSNCPLFKLLSGTTTFKLCEGKAGAYAMWRNLSKYTEEKKDMNTFKKEDLKTGMRVTCRNAEVYIVLLDATDGDVLCEFDGGFNWLDDYNEDLIMKGGDLSEYDIIKIQEPTVSNLATRTSLGKLIWEREEISPLQKEFTELQSQIQALQEKANTIQQQINN